MEKFRSRETFLNHAKGSSQNAYDSFKALLATLEDPKAQNEGIQFLHQLAGSLMASKMTDLEMTQRYHFSFSELCLQQEAGVATRLTLLELPSTFKPEHWSFTFFEGLARYRSTEFQDKSVAELGCGIGWITLALAKQTRPQKIYGLDINPRAILCSKLNLFLNGWNSKGEPTWTHEGRVLSDVVEFHTSDLLQHCRDRKIYLDRIIGCIPQVLNPDPDFSSTLLNPKNLELANDEFLQSLSNYTINQGSLEDQFGLGLIARTVEESVDVLRMSGKMILNLGGRPGAEVLDRLFERRGFSAHRIWQTRVAQAEDTEIDALVKIEEKTLQRFEFYMGTSSDTAISARTASAYAKAGGKIMHGLAVYEAHIREPLFLPKLVQTFRNKGYEGVRNALDLSYSDDSLCLEKISFLSALNDYIQSNPYFPYEGTAGLESLREKLASFFHKYFKLSWENQQFFIAPSRVLISLNILDLFKPKRALIDSQLAKHFLNHPEIIEIPRDLGLICELMENLMPEIVICSISPNEADTGELFQRLCETSKTSSSRVFIDISELIELSSNPRNNGIFRFLAQNPLPEQVTLICGLVKNRLYLDLEICFLISNNKELLENLENSAELTYSRTPVISQIYYNQILQELIHFQLIGSDQNEQKKKNKESIVNPHPLKNLIPLSASASQAFKHPAIAGEKNARTQGLIRMDYGENCLNSPHILQTTILEAFAKKQFQPEEFSCNLEIIKLNQTRFGFSSTDQTRVILGNGVAEIFSEIAAYCGRQNIPLVFPSGSYGHFIASARFHGASVILVPTREEQSFKLTSTELEKALQPFTAPPWVFLTAPVVNPTGALYTSSEIEDLCQVIQDKKGVLLLDSIFSGLEYSQTKDSPKKDPLCLEKFSSLRWMILGGLSKEFAAGGLRIGYGLTTDPELISIGLRVSGISPNAPLRFIVKTIYGELLAHNPNLHASLNAQRTVLKDRADQLIHSLETSGWSCIRPAGGLFLSATRTDPKTIDRIHEKLLQKMGVVINSPDWTGIPGYFRFVLSIPELEFQLALEKLKAFKL